MPLELITYNTNPMKKLILSAILSLMATGVFAQGYQTGVGVRGGYISGVTLKHFIEEPVALEGILSFGRWGFNITGLYEIHARAFDVQGLNWFYGGGAHIGQWNDDYPLLDERGNYAVVGVDGIIGLEYEIEEIPFTLSADWKPSLNFIGYSGFVGFGGAFSIRYVF